MASRLLIADDYADIRNLLERLLCAEHCCDLTEDGLQAIGAWEAARCAGEPYALLILDAAMPHKSGFEVAHHVRTRGDHSTPIIIITGSCDTLTRPHAEYVGVAEVVLKPFDSEALKRRVEELLAH